MAGTRHSLLFFNMHTSMRLRSHTARKHIPVLCTDVWQIILNNIFFYCGTSFGYLRERCRLRAVTKDFFMDEFCYVPTVLNLNLCGNPRPPGSFDGLCRILPRISFQNVQYLLLDRCILTYQDQLALSHGSWNSLTTVSLVNCGLYDWPCSRLVKRLCEQSLNSLKKLDLDQNVKLDTYTFYEMGRLILQRAHILFQGSDSLDLCEHLSISVKQCSDRWSFFWFMNCVVNEIHASKPRLNCYIDKHYMTRILCDVRVFHWMPLESLIKREDTADLMQMIFFSQNCQTMDHLEQSTERFYELPVPLPSVKLVNRGNEQVGRRSLRLM